MGVLSANWSQEIALKWYLVLFSVFFTLPVFSQLRPTRITDSLSTTDQEAQLNHSLLKIDPKDPKKIAEALNRELKQMGLPTINTNSPDFKMTLALSRDFFSSHTVGAAFTDGENLFCLPCEKGMNSFESGIISLSKYQTNLFNMNKQRLTDLAGSCSYDLSKTSVVQINDTQVKKYVCNVEANCTKKMAGTLARYY